MAFLLFVVTVFVNSMKDLVIFIKLVSFGAIFIITLLLFITGIGVYSFSNTIYQFGPASDNLGTDWVDPLSPRTISLINSNFSPIAGILCAGYFLHTCSVPIMRSAQNPEKNFRDLFISYVMVFISYAVVGSFGYIGFLGTSFSSYFIKELETKTSG